MLFRPSEGNGSAGAASGGFDGIPLDFGSSLRSAPGAGPSSLYSSGVSVDGGGGGGGRSPSPALSAATTTLSNSNTNPINSNNAHAANASASVNGDADQSPVKLNQFLATGICGNDILGSCLYAAGLVAVPAGRWAPVCFFVVGVLLYFFRWIYQEVGQALPVNGGTYTLLLNTSSKQAAAFAGSLTLLSYVATAVVSANSAMHYLRELWPELQVYPTVVLLLFIFAVINLIGIRESAYNALIIFSVHLITLTIFMVGCLLYIIDDGAQTLWANLASPPALGDPLAIAYGFCVALLGVTGFETSANYIEAQATGVYPRVLRNVCVLVIVVNPLISLLSMGVLPHALAAGVKNHLVSSAAYAAQGHWLHVLVTLDAVLVLSGSVLTAFIGVQGLAYRMALDGALPQALTSLSALRGTQHVSVLLFFLVAVSLHVLCAADIRVLSGVYTMSFVALLVCFVCGNMLLKRYRGALPRRSPASRTSVLLALTGALLGLAGTAANQPDMALYAVFYVSVVFAVVLACLHRLAILRAVAAALSALNVGARTKAAAVEQIAREQHMGLVFFLQNESNDDLRQVCRYILQNEERRLLKVVKVTPTPLAPAELLSLRTRIDALAAEVSMWTSPATVTITPTIGTTADINNTIANASSTRSPSKRSKFTATANANANAGLSDLESGFSSNNEKSAVSTTGVSSSKSSSSTAAASNAATQSSAIMSSITAAAPVSVPLEAALELQLEAEVGVLSAALVEELHQRWSVPSNFMFVACPTKDTPWEYAALGGVRIIIQGSAAVAAAAAAADAADDDASAFADLNSSNSAGVSKRGVQSNSSGGLAGASSYANDIDAIERAPLLLSTSASSKYPQQPSKYFGAQLPNSSAYTGNGGMHPGGSPIVTSPIIANPAVAAAALINPKTAINGGGSSGSNGQQAQQHMQHAHGPVGQGYAGVYVGRETTEAENDYLQRAAALHS